LRNAILHIILILTLPLFITGCKKTENEVNTGNIEGKITDNTNAQPIPAAEVKISGTNQTIVSGADGSYQFLNLAPKEYQITVSKQNYVQETKPISVTAGRTANLDFALSPFSLTITPANQNVGNTAGTTQFTITSNISWTASIDQPWCSINKSGGSGNDIITVTYQPNTTASERMATLTVTGNTLAPENVTIRQSLHVFSFVTICNQVWMDKNLDVDTYRNGDPIPQVTDAAAWAALTTGAYCYYNNDSATYAATYGKLYNWYAVNDPRGLAPAGWHVASEAEWDIELTGCLGGPSEAGGKMKAVSDLWQFPNVNATNSSGFTGLPGGLLEETTFGSNGYYGFWWSSSDDASIPSFAIAFGLISSAPDIIYMGMPKEYGLSVRCIRD